MSTLDWFDALRIRHREVFESRDWRGHVQSLNERLGLTGRYQFTESRWAPDFHLGPLHRFVPGEWVAAISLNPKEMNPANRVLYESQTWTADEAWAYRCKDDPRVWQPEDFYERSWAIPWLTVLAELTGDRSVMDTPEVSYLSRVGAFEVVPYASHQYWTGTAAMMREDPGCDLARDIAVQSILNCPPVAVMANGKDAVSALSEWFTLDTPLASCEYRSVRSPGRILKHWQSSLTVNGVRVPVAGVSFWRRQGGHNAYEEIAQLAREILARV